MKSRDFNKLEAYVLQLSKHGIPACDIVVWKNHDLVYRTMAGYSDYEGKIPVSDEDIYNMYNMLEIGNLFILGDSYSTFEKHIPENCRTWYTEEKVERTDVDRVEQTWWYQFVRKINAELVLNCSSSGTTICNTGYAGKDCSDISFIGRFYKCQ